MEQFRKKKKGKINVRLTKTSKMEIKTTFRNKYINQSDT